MRLGDFRFSKMVSKLLLFELFKFIFFIALGVCFGSLNFILLIICYLILLYGDVKLNPGPNIQKIQTFEIYEKQFANLRSYPKLLYMNMRSVNKKHEEISNLLQQQSSQTCLIITETWSDIIE